MIKTGCGVLLATGMLLLGTPAMAETEISGSVTLATDYVYRGTSQTGEDAAIQGSIDLTDDSGFYAGVWASNISFDGTIEIDLYAGYGGSFSDGVDYDVGVLRYEYPDDNRDNSAEDYRESSFNELYGSITIEGVTVGLAYSSDFFNESGKAIYYHIDYGIDLPNEFSLGLHYGKQSVDNNAAYFPDYADYSVSVARPFKGIDWSLTWHTTNLSKAECGGDVCASRIVFALSRSL